MTIRILFLISVLVINTIYAQNKGLISGVVKDKENLFLPGAYLKLDKYNRYTVSNKDGEFVFLNVPTGNYNLEVSYIGYQTTKISVEVVSDKNVVLDIILEDNISTTNLSDIVLTGDILKGQAKSLNQQKTNTKISNVISSDQVGRFPDANIGDALKRISGITMQNDQGEARNIIIRGLSPELNSVTLNGNRIPSAEGDNRNVQIDLIPSDMISNIEVSKTLTSDMDADAIGGSVNLSTRAVPNKTILSGTFSMGYVPIRESPMYQGSFIYGERFFDKKLGIVISGSVQDKNYGSDNIEAVWTYKDNKEYISQFDIRKYDVRRTRRSGSAAIDYKINDNNNISVDIMYNWRDDRENRYRTRYRNMVPDQITGDIITGDIRRETKGGINNHRNDNTRLEDQRIQSYSIKGGHLIDEILDIDWSISYSGASEDRPGERYIDFEQKKVSLTQDISDGNLPFIKTYDEDMDKMSLRRITQMHLYTKEDEYSAYLNGRIPLSLFEEQKGRLRFGFKTRIKDKLRDNIFYSYKPNFSLGSLSKMENVIWDGKNFNAGSKYQPGMFVNREYLGNLDLININSFTENLEPSEFLGKNYSAKEQINAGYLRWDQNISENLLMVLGARIEYTSIKYSGNNVRNDTLIGKNIGENSYTNIFPNITLKYDIDKDFIIRTAFSTAIARPNYYYLVPFTSITTDQMDLSIGNPHLKPTYSYNFDIMTEYYFESIGLVSGGGFYKNMKNFIYTYKNVNYTLDNFSKDFPGVINPIQIGDVWTFTQYKNGKDVDVFGIEISMQRKLDFIPVDFFKSFGMYLNYTYTHSNARGISGGDGTERINISLPGTAPHMANSSLFWENDWISARVSLNYTSDYINALGDKDYNDSYYDKQLFLDANMGIKFTSQLRFFAEANNLTNQPLRYYQGASNRMMKLEYYRSTFNFGLKYNL